MAIIYDITYTPDMVKTALLDNEYSKAKAAKDLKCGKLRLDSLMTEFGIDFKSLRREYIATKDSQKTQNIVERNKRSKQYSAEELCNALSVCNNNKEDAAKYLGIGLWSFREQLKRHDLNNDHRVFSNSARTVQAPPKEELENLYFTNGKSLLDIGEIYGISNVTVKKWFVDYSIPQRTAREDYFLYKKSKMQDVWKQKYGAYHYFASDEGKRKVADYNMKKYGVHFKPQNNSSNAELEILDFFNEIQPTFSKQYNYGYEYDGFNSEHKVAFEYCGLYWHREGVKGKNLHQNKFNAAADNGVDLFTIFEDEWNNRKEQVKAYIKNYFGEYEYTANAEDLTVKTFPANNDDIAFFFHENHIKGDTNFVNNIINYSLVDSDGNILMGACLSKNRWKSDEILVSRFCAANGFNVIGGAQKLFSKIREDGYTGIKVYSDNCWPDNGIYEKCGFEFLEDEQKRHFVIMLSKAKDRVTDFEFRKILNENRGSNKTDYEILIENGYDRVWDCGKKVYILK